MGAGGAADRFWLELQALYQAAGKPTLNRLVHLGLEQRPQISISDSTINGWLNRKAVPTGRKNERYLTAMVAFLQARAKSSTRYEPLPSGEWGKLLHQAQAERAAGQKSGRPRRPAVSSRSRDADERWRAVAAEKIEVELVHARDVRADQLGTMPPPGVLVGRDRELAMLTELVKGVAASRGSAV